MLLWDEDFCSALAQRGFAVARFDNRDVGLSTHFSAVRSRIKVLLRPPYRLEDMADDAVAVMDALGWDDAHLVGMSLGGLIGQLTAIRHPSRVRTLSLIVSFPGRRLRCFRYRRFLAVGRMALSRRDGPGGAEHFMVDLFRFLSPHYPVEETWARGVGRACYERDRGQLPSGWLGPLTGGERQMFVVLARRTPIRALAQIRLPTLVIQGQADPVLRPSAGRAIANVIRGARLVSYAGMGHWPARELWPAIIDEICALAD
jgi:pimeloyl-ACP methyl ester carboxylesterase